MAGRIGCRGLGLPWFRVITEPTSAPPANHGNSAGWRSVPRTRGEFGGPWSNTPGQPAPRPRFRSRLHGRALRRPRMSRPRAPRRSNSTLGAVPGGKPGRGFEYRMCRDAVHRDGPRHRVPKPRASAPRLSPIRNGRWMDLASRRVSRGKSAWDFELRRSRTAIPPRR